MLNTKQMLVKVGVATTSRQDIGLLLNRDIILKLPQAIVRFLEQNCPQQSLNNIFHVKYRLQWAYRHQVQKLEDGSELSACGCVCPPVKWPGVAG